MGQEGQEEAEAVTASTKHICARCGEAYWTAVIAGIEVHGHQCGAA